MTCGHSSPWQCLMPWLLISMACALQGCHWPAPPPAPSPTLNPHPQKTSQLKISVQDGSGVNNVEVKTIWAVGNIGCAPIHPISGAAIVKQVVVNEKVKWTGSHYVATIIDDRFLPGKCGWVGDTYQVIFRHDDRLLADGGGGPSNFGGDGRIELTCIPPPHIPLCELRSKEGFDRSHFQGVFNATLEITK